MADHILEARVWLARPRDEVFAFFTEPEHLPLLVPPAYRMRLAAAPPALAAGAVLDWRLTWLGLSLRWRTLVREWDPPYRFVTVQVRGPCARWEHRYRFLAEAGGTWLEDRVTYRLPLGPLGRAGHALLVRRQLQAAWAYRTRRLGALVGPVGAPTA